MTDYTDQVEALEEISDLALNISNAAKRIWSENKVPHDIYIEEGGGEILIDQELAEEALENIDTEDIYYLLSNIIE